MTGAGGASWRARDRAVVAGVAVVVLVLMAGAVALARWVRSGSEARQALTAQVVAVDVAMAALAVALLGLVAAGIWRLRAPGVAAAERMQAAAVGTAGGRWPVLGQVELEVLGVRRPRESTRRPREQLPYVPRAVDERLRAALAKHRFVLVHGPAGVGKSRSTAQMCSGLFGGRPVVIPAVRDGALRQLAEADAVPVGAVVWLDDLDRHLQAGVDAALVRRLLTLDQVRIVATMRAAAY